MGVHADKIAAATLELDALGRYRRDGYLVVPGLLDPHHVEQCLTALGDLAANPGLEPGQRDGTGAFIALEPEADDASAAAMDRADLTASSATSPMARRRCCARRCRPAST